MTYRVKLLPEARQDVKDLQQFYNKQVVGYHRSQVHRFPVSIYYAVIVDEVVVAGILDNRKNPKKIYKTLLKR
jgi:hypothetical protein